MYLIDTNLIVYFLEDTLPANGKMFLNDIIDTECNISIITKMEALGFNFSSASDEEVMKTFINGTNIINISDEVAEGTIIIRKSKKTDLPDAIIAATALANNFTLLTHNKKDFKNISELKVIDPFEM